MNRLSFIEISLFILLKQSMESLIHHFKLFTEGIVYHQVQHILLLKHQKLFIFKTKPIMVLKINVFKIGRKGCLFSF
jgi:hypothetical protein